MNIDKILSKERQYNYLDRVEAHLQSKGLTFKDLKNYIRCGSSINGVGTKVLIDKYGKDVKLPEIQTSCMCGHRIVEQCYLCPIGNQDLTHALVVGNHCIRTWGIKPALRGKGLKVECEVCGSMVNKSGLARHQKQPKCKNMALRAHTVEDSTVSTTASETSSSCHE